MKTLFVEKELMQILKSDELPEIKYIKIVKFIHKTMNDWTWPEKDESWGNIEFKQGYNKARRENLQTIDQFFNLGDL